MDHNHNENNFSLLSKEIFQSILQFLPMKDLAKMEMALLNHILRPHFLSALDRMIIPSLKDLNLLSWVMSRNLIPQEFCQHDDDQEEIEDASNILPRGYCPSHDNSEPKIPFIAFLLKIRNHLKSLSLDDLSEASFGALGAFPALTKVTLNTPRRLSAKTLVNFWSLNPQLQELSMSFAKNFGSDLISALVHVCPNLKHLSLSHNHWFNDDCVVKLAQSNLNLLSLDVGNTSVQNDESIHLILNSFPNLHNLSFYECEISKEMGELSLRQIAIPSLLSDDVDIQMMGFACLTAYDNEVLPLENDTFFSIVSVIVPLLQHKNKIIRTKALDLLQGLSTDLVYHVSKLLEYAIQHPEVLEPGDVLREMISQKSKRRHYDPVQSLYASYSAFLNPKKSGPKQSEMKVISFYEENGFPELIPRPNSLQTAETHFFFMNLIHHCI